MVLYLHGIYFLVDEPVYVLYVGLIALGTYFAVVRLSQHSLNRRLGFIGSSLAVLSCLIFLFITASKKWSWPLQSWQVYSLSVAVFTLLLGSIFLSLSIVWALYSTARTRLS